jgi:sugar phosphate isomerase/epimerase
MTSQPASRFPARSDSSGQALSLSLNQATIKYAPLEKAIHVTRKAGIGSIGLWRGPVAEAGLGRAVSMLADSGLRVSSLCRGGFFTAAEPAARNRALDDNRRAIEETAALAEAGAPGSAAVLVLVPGGLPEGDRDLPGARERVRDAVGDLASDARDAGVTLAIEPMHPIYAADRGVISTLGQALDIAEQFPSCVQVVIDAFHVWWDPELAVQVERAGRLERIAAYQIGDWITPLPSDSLLARGLPGTGHADLRTLTSAVIAAGYRGDIEVEVFNQDVWNADPDLIAANVATIFAAVTGLPALA